MAIERTANFGSPHRGRARWAGRYLPTTLFPVVAATTAAIAGVNHGAVRVYWTLGAIGATAGTAVLNGLKERNAGISSALAIAAKTKLARALTRTGEPLITALGNVTTAKTAQDRKTATEVLLHMAVDVGQRQCGQDSGVVSNVRSIYYELLQDRLERKAWAGRQGNKPRKDFQRGRSAHDDEALRLAQSEEVLLCEDLENKPPPHFADNKGRSYKSFIAVPVRAGEISFGMLLVDSDQPFALNDVDRGYVILLAGLLAAGLARDLVAIDPSHLVPPQPTARDRNSAASAEKGGRGHEGSKLAT